MKISNRISMLAAWICLIASLAQPCAGQRPLGSLYRGNLPGGPGLPRTFDLGQRMQEVTAEAVLQGMVRLPNGHYLFQIWARSPD